MPVPIRTREAPRDPVGRAHRRAAFVRIAVRTVLLCAVIGGVSWAGWFLLHAGSASPEPTTERVPLGIWCRGDVCQYFDRSHTRWGSALPSRGPLLLLVEDERTDSAIPDTLVEGILTVAEGLPTLGVRAISMELPDTAPGDLRVTVDKPYTLLMDAEGDVADQLATLGVLLADKAKDAAWAPTSIDLRTPGRVYYK